MRELHLTLACVPGPRTTSCVLVVEDEPDARNALAEFVRRLGHEVVVATTASEALASILLKQPDRVLLDLMLPGLSGLEVLRLIRTNKWPMRVAVATALHDPLAFEDLRHLRADAIFRKPLHFRSIEKWLAAA